MTRADGTVENVNPGDPVMLTKGMKVKPVLCEENFTVNVSWEYAFIGEYEDKAQNIANYSFTSDHAFTDNGGYTVPKVLMHSSDSHIYREGLPAWYNNCIKF